MQQFRPYRHLTGLDEFCDQIPPTLAERASARSSRMGHPNLMVFCSPFKPQPGLSPPHGQRPVHRGPGVGHLHCHVVHGFHMDSQEMHWLCVLWGAVAGSRVGGVRVQGPVPRGRGSEKRSAISVQRSKGPGTKKAPAIRKAAGLNPRWQRVLGILHRRMPEFAARSYRIASKIQDVVVLA